MTVWWSRATLQRLVAAAVCFLMVAVLAPTASAQAPPEKGDGSAQPAGGPAPAESPAEGASGRRDATREQPAEEDFDELAAIARRDGQVRVVVGLPVDFTPEGNITAEQRRNQRAEIASEQAGVRKDLAGTQHRIPHEFVTVPFMAVEVTEEGLERLRASDHVASVAADEAVPPTLAESAPVVQSDLMGAAGFTGTGKMVAILDTGVDRAHSFFGGRVIEEACYSTTNATEGSTTLCPNGQSSQTGTGAGVHCTGIDGCEHGTHVAGIAAGSGSGMHGVARNANIMAVQVFSRFDGTHCGGGTCVLTWSTDQIAGLERVYALRNTHSIAAANMSLGGGYHTAHCDSDPRKTIIDNLASVNIATVIASGNSYHKDGIGAPACISSAITVGATDIYDNVADFSNSHPTMIDLLAPGNQVNSSIPGGGFVSYPGTSMAAPQVAGAWAALRHHRPTASVATLRSDLRTTGRVVTDDWASPPHSHPRIRVHSAAFGLPANSNMFANATAVTVTPKQHFQPTDGATVENGEPAPCGSIGATVWYSYTPSTSGTLTADTFGSNFDTVLAAYTGASVTGLTQRACNDDDTSGGDGFQSKISIPVSAGQTYRLQVGGWNGRTGDARLNVSGPPPVISATVPAAPTGVSAAATGPTSARVAFTPGSDGGSPITSFQARCDSSTGGVTRTASGAASPIDVNNLTTGETYRCRVRATNAIGTGPYSAYSNTFVPGSAVADFTGDGMTDFSFYRPSNGRWFVNGISGSTAFGGVSGDVPVPADYNGDGTSEFALYRPARGRWYVHGVSGSTAFGGVAGDVPVPADYTGDGATDFAIYRPGSGRWYVRGVSGSTQFGGQSGDVPVPGDYNGDGTTEFAIYRPGSGRWFVHGVSGSTAFGGVAGDVPVPADYDGDGATEFAIYRPGSGRWYVYGVAGSTRFGGVAGDVPVPGDYNGDGTSEFGLYRPGSGRWYVHGVSGSTLFGGRTGDRPLPLPHAIYHPYFGAP